MDWSSDVCPSDLKLAGMRDEHCAAKLTQALKAVKGVDDAKISFDQSKATVSFDESLVSTQRLQVAVEEAGYRIAKPVHGEDGAVYGRHGRECCRARGGKDG